MKTPAALPKNLFLIIVLCLSLSSSAIAGEAEWKALNMEAVILFQQGEAEAGRTKMKEAMDYAIEEFGREHINTAKSLNNMGNVSLQEGDYAQAELYYEEALDVEKKILKRGEDGMISDTLYNLAMTYLMRGNKDKGRELLKEALKIKKDQKENDLASLARIETAIAKLKE